MQAEAFLVEHAVEIVVWILDLHLHVGIIHKNHDCFLLADGREPCLREQAGTALRALCGCRESFVQPGFHLFAVLGGKESACGGITYCGSPDAAAYSASGGIQQSIVEVASFAGQQIAVGSEILVRALIAYESGFDDCAVGLLDLQYSLFCRNRSRGCRKQRCEH